MTTRRSVLTVLGGLGVTAALVLYPQPETVTILGAPESSGQTDVLPEGFKDGHDIILPPVAPRYGEVLKIRLAEQHEIPATCHRCKAGSTWVGYWGEP